METQVKTIPPKPVALNVESGLVTDDPIPRDNHVSQG